MEIHDKRHSIERISILAFSFVAVLIIGCSLLVGHNLRLQNNMLEASSLSYELRILLDRSSSQANLLFESENIGQLSDRVLLNVRNDFVQTAEKITQNNKRLRSLLLDKQNNPGSLFRALDLQNTSLEMDKIDKIWSDFQTRIDEIADYNTATLRAGNRYWQPADTLIAYNSPLFKSVSNLNHLVYESSLFQNQSLRILYTIIFILVLTGVWLIWFWTLRPLARRLKASHGEIMEKNEHLNYQANHDSLTSIYNRTAFNTRIRLIEKDGAVAPCCLVLVDLDDFKTLNDTLGHDAGDVVLSKIAHDLKQSPLEGEAAYRLGGDEFAILIDNTPDKKTLTERLDVLLRHIRDPLIIDGKEVHCTCSIGVAWRGDDSGKTFKTIFKAADSALYQVKKNGRNDYCCYEEVGKGCIAELNRTDDELRKAVIDKQIVVYYQPIIDMQENCLYGFEALVRWLHPEKGSLPAAEWFKDAERLNLEDVITYQMIETIGLDSKRWRKEGLPVFPVSINIPDRMLTNKDVFDAIRKAVGPYSEKSWLGIEVDESIFLDRAFEKIKGQLERAKNLGIPITLDHFGTGFASLSHLQKIPFETLKIDQTFVSQILYDKHANAIVSSLVNLSNSLGKALICEGVEDRDTRRALSDLGCMYSQGPIHSEVLSLRKASALIRMTAQLEVA